MEDSAQRTREDVAGSESFSYNSIVLKKFIEILEPRQSGRLFDCGPVCGDNIDFFSQRVERLYICDLFRLLDKDRRTGFPPGRYWRHLDYPAEIFDGIVLWDLIDRLDEPEAYSLIKRCYAMTKPGGTLLLFSLGSQISPGGRTACSVRGDYEVRFRPAPFSNLPLRHRQNRDFLHIVAPYTTVKSLIYRNGIREFLFQKT